MTKQPFLTDFPLTIFATAKRRLQAAIRQSSAIITRRSLSGYAVLFEDVLSGDFLTSIDPTQLRPSGGFLGVACPDPRSKRLLPEGSRTYPKLVPHL